MRLPWTTGSSSFDEDLGRKVLALARENPNTEKDLEQSLELRGATHAIIESLPKRVRKKLTHQHKVDIASVIVLQRAAATQVAYEDCGLTFQPETPVDEYAIPDRPDTGRAEEA